jgi:hypothetical protein
MLKYGIPDLSPMFDADVRWLSHYGFSAAQAPSAAAGLELRQDMTSPERFSPPVCEDYSVDHFDRRPVAVRGLPGQLMATRQPVIANKTFTNCVIEGPAVLLALSGVEFDACRSGRHQGRSALALLMPMAKNKVTGAIAFKDTLSGAAPSLRSATPDRTPSSTR